MPRAYCGTSGIETLLEQYDMYVRQESDIMGQVSERLERIPGTAEMLTIPGVGIVTLAGFLAEVGDLSGYEHGQQIVRLAGLNLKENSSGKRKGLPGITKRGRSRLRALLFRSVMSMLANNQEFNALHRYYTKRNVNPLKKKQHHCAMLQAHTSLIHARNEDQCTRSSNDHSVTNGSLTSSTSFTPEYSKEGQETIEARRSRSSFTIRATTP